MTKAHGTFDIVDARRPDEIAAVRQLFLDYAAWLNVDLCFQGFDDEMARFPAGYDRLLLARADGAPAGAVGVRPFDGPACEMKRLYVPDAYRGRVLGRALSVRLIDDARAMGYTCMRLDTLDRLTEALHLYRSLGFEDCPPYYANPLDGVIYMEKRL